MYWSINLSWKIALQKTVYVLAYFCEDTNIIFGYNVRAPLRWLICNTLNLMTIQNVVME